MEKVTKRLQQTQNQWTKKVNQIFRICGIANTISTLGVLLILDPRRTESIKTFPTPLRLWLPVSIIGLIILEALRQHILRHVNERLLNARATALYRIQCRLKYPFPYRFLWDILCAQFSLASAIELILILIYKRYTRLIKFNISAVFVWLLLFMVYQILQGHRRIQRELSVEAVWNFLGLDSPRVSIDERGEGASSV
ncbi:hypothetical protein Moror_9768 [Moniliophthora roreri MCA 2997]|uniref:Uncharacterized protein n=1 Tax=Moniliophthora roreri (strain MCA 2997) TaxID=1381753 RepID=V2X297_MONRO|nr:hypothetical protein Moror_9768 [Moniliophthora roreri MCA 2997]